VLLMLDLYANLSTAAAEGDAPRLRAARARTRAALLGQLAGLAGALEPEVGCELVGVQGAEHGAIDRAGGRGTAAKALRVGDRGRYGIKVGGKPHLEKAINSRRSFIREGGILSQKLSPTERKIAGDLVKRLNRAIAHKQAKP